MAIPSFIIGSLTALAIFVCLHSSEKSGLSGSERNHFNTKRHYMYYLQNNIVTFIFHMAH